MPCVNTAIGTALLLHLPVSLRRDSEEFLRRAAKGQDDGCCRTIANDVRAIKPDSQREVRAGLNGICLAGLGEELELEVAAGVVGI